MLNELLEAVESNIPYAKKITPMIRKQATATIKDCVYPWVTDWFNSDLENVINGNDGSELDYFKTLTYIRYQLIKEEGEKVESHPLNLGELVNVCKNIKYFRCVFIKHMLLGKVIKINVELVI